MTVETAAPTTNLLTLVGNGGQVTYHHAPKTTAQQGLDNLPIIGPVFTGLGTVVDSGPVKAVTAPVRVPVETTIGAASSVGKTVSGSAQFVSDLTNPAYLLRIALVVVGLILVLVGVDKLLSGSAVVNIAKDSAKAGALA